MISFVTSSKLGAEYGMHYLFVWPGRNPHNRAAYEYPRRPLQFLHVTANLLQLFAILHVPAQPFELGARIFLEAGAAQA
jgi:hypothetical protein